MAAPLPRLGSLPATCALTLLLVAARTHAQAEGPVAGAAPSPARRSGEAGEPSDPFAMYRPNYFISGVRAPAGQPAHADVKFQISVRYELLADRPARWRALLAYSQKSFWNVYDASGPFRENNYNPELFLEWYPRYGPASHFKLGAAHESNGLGGAASRSWDRGLAEARFVFGDVTLDSIVWWPVRLSENPRILRFFGWGELGLRVALDENCELEVVRRIGSRFDRGSVLAGLNVGSLLRLFGMTEQKWFTPHFYVQLWHGYGESLIDYDVLSTALRAGVMLHP